MAGSGAKALETKINRLYDRFRPLATRFGYSFARPAVTVDGRPNVVFLGNHSSGKSSFINHLLEDAPVQDTGVAPTDDGFTVLLYGTTECDVHGPAALSRLPAEFAGLRLLGPAFLHRLKVKVRDRAVLKAVNLIDSPGMVDSAHGNAQRDYDFMTAVRNVAELSDLVLFCFDPDKPGTTGETVAALRQCLVGMEFKLRILLNKCDSFDSMYDFARAYGALCWNLAHVLRTKDLPTVYTTYLPIRQARAEARVDLADFDRHRGVVIEQIQQASQRRTDNLVAGVQSDFAKLALQVDMIGCVQRRICWRRVRQGACAALLVLAAGALAWWGMGRVLPLPDEAGLWHWRRLFGLAAALLAALAAGGLSAGLFRQAVRRYRAQLLNRLDELFEEEYAEFLVPGNRSDLRQHWAAVREPVRTLLTGLDRRMPLWGGFARGGLSSVIDRTLPGLARNARD